MVHNSRKEGRMEGRKEDGEEETSTSTMKNVSSELFLIIKILREGGGRGVQDGEHVYAHGGFMLMWQNQYNIVK